MEEERRDHEAKMKKMEQEMEQVFEMKVKEKTQKLKDSETDVTDSIVAFHFSFISFRILLLLFF
jgi:septin 7